MLSPAAGPRRNMARAAPANGLGNSIREYLHATAPQNELWEAVRTLGDVSAAASTCRKRNPQLPNDEHVQTLNWLLWLWPYINHRPHPSTTKAGHSLSGVNCRITETVVFINNSINNFFFSSSEGGQVKRKARQSSCTRAAIMDHFRRVHKRCSASDVVAYYVSLPQSSHTKVTPYITYFNMDELEDFLLGSGSESAGDGILQKFVDCTGHNHTVYRATWAPYNFTLESRSNKNRMLPDPARPTSIFDRTATFDGDEHQSVHHQQDTNAYVLRPMRLVVEKVVSQINGLFPVSALLASPPCALHFAYLTMSSYVCGPSARAA